MPELISLSDSNSANFDIHLYRKMKKKKKHQKVNPTLLHSHTIHMDSRTRGPYTATIIETKTGLICLYLYKYIHSDQPSLAQTKEFAHFYILLCVYK